MENYPRTIVIDNPKLAKFLKEKSELVLNGRKISEDIETVEQEMETIDLEVQSIEKSVDLSDLKTEAEKITEEFNIVVAKMETIKKQLSEKLHLVVPQEIKDKYEATKKTKEELENKRNKIALKVQKWNDKIIPMGQKAMKPFLQNEFDDFDTLRIENGEVVGTIFNHLEDWKKMFYNRKNAN